MNVFILCTGRCGSVTFTESAKHITNYSAAHESRTHYTGAARFSYPANHIEADNRLSWLLGRLDTAFGNRAFYVHLRRDTHDTARSFLQRHDKGIMGAYRKTILMGAERRNKEDDLIAFCVDYCETVNENVRLFLKDKTKKMDFRMEEARDQLATFWERIGAEGDFDKALAEWGVRHNAG